MKFKIDPNVLRNIGRQPSVNTSKLKEMIAGNLKGVANPAAVNTAISSAFDTVGGGGICAAGVTPLARRNGIPDVKGYADLSTAGPPTPDPNVGIAGSGIPVAAGTGAITAFLAASTWDTAVAPRRFLLGDNDPKNIDPIYRHCPLNRVEAYVEVFACDASATSPGTIDVDLSESLTALFERNFAIVVDPDGLSDNFQLAPTFLADMPVGGIAFDPDNQPTYQNKALVRFDQCGAGELQNYSLADHASAVDLTMTVIWTVIGHFDFSAKHR